jgi:RHS repeat-associated protein
MLATEQTGTQTRTYTYHPDGTPLAQQAGGVTSLLRPDPFGNTTTVTDTTGAVQRRYTLTDPFGELTPTAPTGPDSRLGFQGQYNDPLSGAYHLRARDYGTNTGRFGLLARDVRVRGGRRGRAAGAVVGRCVGALRDAEVGEDGVALPGVQLGPVGEHPDHSERAGRDRVAAPGRGHGTGHRPDRERERGQRGGQVDATVRADPVQGLLPGRRSRRRLRGSLAGRRAGGEQCHRQNGTQDATCAHHAADGTGAGRRGPRGTGRKTGR